jgi:hypothetical protein
VDGRVHREFAGFQRSAVRARTHCAATRSVPRGDRAALESTCVRNSRGHAPAVAAGDVKKARQTLLARGG